jgi:repressor LexA
MEDLHPIQQKLLDLLSSNSDEPLTIRELQSEVGATSTSVVSHHITQLEKKGFIKKNLIEELQ